MCMESPNIYSFRITTNVLVGRIVIQHRELFLYLRREQCRLRLTFNHGNIYKGATIGETVKRRNPSVKIIHQSTKRTNSATILMAGPPFWTRISQNTEKSTEQDIDHIRVFRPEVIHAGNPFAHTGKNITRPFCYLRGKCSFCLI